jgi:hypothetical protein
MRVHFHVPSGLADTVGRVCAGAIILAMLAFAIAEAIAPLVRLVRP